MKKTGWTCGAYDLLHAGHIELFKDCKSKCEHLIVGLQSDPTLDRPEKNKPIQTLEERLVMLQSIKYVDEIVIYHTEDDLYAILKAMKPNVRISGWDWRGKKFTGCDLDMEYYFHHRLHNWSTTNLRKRVYEAEKEKHQ